MSTYNTSIFKDPNVTKHLSHLHDNYVVVPAEKSSSNIVFVYKSHYNTKTILLEDFSAGTTT
jgi:hypothetical protein